MRMNKLYPNHSFLSKIYKHKKLPIFMSNEFDFYRCVEFNESFYGKTVSTLFHGNLRDSDSSNRYADLFPKQKISYWAASPKTSRDEIKRHGAGNNIITFWAYDDASSSFPTIENREALKIVDGVRLNFDLILEKYDDAYESGKQVQLTDEEKMLLQSISIEEPDCLAYRSKVDEQGINFIFFEKGFEKLSLRQVKLRLGNLPSKNSNIIWCATTSDYMPHLESYGEYFEPLVKIGKDETYYRSDEYLQRKQNYEKNWRR